MDRTVVLIVGFFILILFGSIALLVRAGINDSKAKDVACEKMWALARNATDSIAVIERCEMPSETTQPIIIMQ